MITSMRRPFGKWMPDLPPLKLQEGLTICDNVVPVAGGYGPMPGLLALDAFSLSAEPRGALRGILADGTNFFVAGTATTLERRLESSWSDVSRTSGYTNILNRRWNLQQFGSSVFASNYANEMQAIDLSRDMKFSNVVGAPRAYHLAVAESFLFAGDIFSRNLGVARDGIAWSAVSNPYNWPDPNTDIATQVLSGEQVLEGDGGLVNGIVSGSEVVAIFQENAIWRADFVGNDIVWRFQRMITEHGLLIKDAAIAIERRILFIASDGFRIFDYTSSQNIGKDVVNTFFFDDYDSDYPDSVSMTRDPRRTRIFISYAGAGNTLGIPNRILIYDWMLDSWAIIRNLEHFSLIGAGGIAASLDSPDTAEDPDRIGGVSDDLDPPGDESFDDRQLGAGLATLGAFDSIYQLSEFSGPSMSGRLITGHLELTPDHWSMLTEVRPLVDGEETTVQVAKIARRADDTENIVFGPAAPMSDSGKCNVRANSRYHQIRFNLPIPFTEATDYDLRFTKSGRR